MPKDNFEYVKPLFEKIVEDITCKTCLVVPRKGPIYQSAKGQTLCSHCKNANNFNDDFLNNYHQVFGFEKILEDLPNACKFRKHNCKTVLEQVDLDTHEEICEYREVLCPFGFCQEILPALKLQDHLTSEHFAKEHLLKQYCQENNDSSIFSAKIHIKDDEDFDENGFWCAQIKTHHHQTDLVFFLHVKKNSCQKFMNIWLQFCGTKFEKENFDCILKFGSYTFQNKPYSLDMNKELIYDDAEYSDEGFLVPFGVVKKK